MRVYSIDITVFFPFKSRTGHGPPVVLLHGGLSNSDYWGNQVKALSAKHTVISIDSRGHGRSSRDEKPYGYDLMADGDHDEAIKREHTEYMASPIILTENNLSSENLGRTMATALVSITEAGSTPLEGFLIMLHSASSKRAAIIGREQVEKGHQATMAAALKGAHHEERAALVMALVSGFQVMCQMLELSALAKADPQVLIDLLTPLFQQLVDGQPGPI